MREEKKMQSEERYPGFREDERLVGVVPSPRQIAHQKMEYFGFIHFTVNTFTGREWGNGEESPSIFNPEKLDAGQWAETAVRGGMTADSYLQAPRRFLPVAQRIYRTQRQKFAL